MVFPRTDPPPKDPPKAHLLVYMGLFLLFGLRTLTIHIVFPAPSNEGFYFSACWLYVYLSAVPLADWKKRQATGPSEPRIRLLGFHYGSEQVALFNLQFSSL